MTSALRPCPKCGSEIPADAPEGACPGCLLEDGLRRVPHPSVAAIGGYGAVDSTGIPNKFGDFEITRRKDGSLWELGRGGMGVTYLAVDNVLRRKVALKVLDVPAAARTSHPVREHFLREARATAALRHPNVAAVYRFGASPDDSHCYYAMELVEGETLEARVRREGPLNPKLVLEIAMQITRALMAAAAHGLIHRDLKPGNIMLTRGDAETAELEVKVIDFGLAKAIADAGGEMDLTRGEFVGTPNFASPEQFESGPVDVRSDIYSLGATLWFALTGKTPLAGRNIQEIRSAQKSNALTLEELKAARVPLSLRSLLQSMLAFDPAARPGIQDLAAQLRRCSALADIEIAAEVKKEIQLEIAHVLFIDIVGYSKLSINEEQAAVDELTQIVRSTDQFQKAEAAERLIKIPSGDGMALVFYTSPDAPVRCAMQISRALKEHQRLHIRMGIHSGPVSGVVDVAGGTNLAGAGLNLAQRVMKGGDAGHILLSKRVAEDLSEFDEWRPLLHDLGRFKVKHGVQVAVVNLCSDEVGNPRIPQTFRTVRKQRARLRWAEIAAALLLLAGIVAAFVLVSKKTARSTSIAPEKSIAVLPFENLSADPENAFFTDGVQDEILNDLAKIADLKVISRTSVMQYKTGGKRNVREIANALGVANVVEGSVQRAANRVRVSAQLIDAKTDTHLWVNSYDRPLDDVFAIQSEIAKAIAGQLEAKLSPAEKAAIEQPPTTNLVVYDCYLRAEKLWAVPTNRIPQDMHEIIRLLDQAVAYDPTFLLAYCELARANAYVYHLRVDHSPARLALAEEARNIALRLGPARAEPHLAAAWVAYHCHRDYEKALIEVGIAQRGLPNNASVFSLPAYIARRQGRWEECIRNLERAVELDPHSVWLLTDIAQVNEQHRRFPEEAAAWDRVLAVVPGDPSTRVSRALVDLDSHAETQPAYEAIQTVVRNDPSAVDAIAAQWLYLALCRRDAVEISNALGSLSPEGIIPYNVRIPRSFCEGLAARSRGDAGASEKSFAAARVEMEKIVREQSDNAQALCVLGMIDAALGRKKDALREGRWATELLPVTKDALAGAQVLANLAVTYAWAGENDLAIKLLEELVRIPSPVTYGQLRLHPFWDPLRGDPRFEKLVEEAKKPVALK